LILRVMGIYAGRGPWDANITKKKSANMA
jgi:hypothetical protein